MCAHAHMHVNAHIHTCVFTCFYMLTCTCQNTHTHMHMWTCMCTHACTCFWNENIHTHMCVCSWKHIAPTLDFLLQKGATQGYHHEPNKSMLITFSTQTDHATLQLAW